MSAAAAAAMNQGPLPASDADVAAKAAVNAASAAAYARLAPGGAPTAAEAASAGGAGSPQSPSVSLAFAGQFDSGVSPPDTTGAVGTTRIIELVNRRYMVTNRAGGVLSSGTLNNLAGWGTAVNSFDPQVIWDPTTNRFYYTMDSVVSSTDNRLAFGFSKSSSPNSAADWCKYYINYGSLFPDYPKLGDSQYFLLIGVDVYQGNPFLRADVLALAKPVGTGTITTCPTFSALLQGRSLIFTDIRDNTNNKIFSPAPANQIDNFTFGYAVARNISLPSTKLWIVPIFGGSTGNPTRAATRLMTVPSYAIPSDASQPTFGQFLDTSDTRMQQAVLSRNPARGNAFSLFTAQAIPNTATGSQIRYYEIDPTFNPPILRRTGLITSTTTTFLFYPAISSDRRVSNAATGRNIVVAYNVVRRPAPSINPRIVAGSSLNGAAFSFALVHDGAGPYRDFTCGSSGQTCRWGDYSGAAPDPLPQGGATSAVGVMLEYSPGGAMSTAISNWRTWVATIRP
jgi:hypothetical protein